MAAAAFRAFYVFDYHHHATARAGRTLQTLKIPAGFFFISYGVGGWVGVSILQYFCELIALIRVIVRA